MADKFQLKAILTAVDKITPTTKQITKSFKIMHKSVRDIGSATQGLMTSVGISSAAIGYGLFSAVKKVVGVSAEFEKFQAILETIEGSSEKAKNSMAWVQEFAIKTPFELATVMDSFVKLKTYGIDPTAGALSAAGNAASAMGKPIEQAVEAIADAMTGENERLKEFGIKASKSGDKIMYSYSKNGKEMVKVAKASNRAMIEATIKGIWNEQFSGAMDKQSKTWNGMWSNMMDGVNKFILKIGNSGFFDAVKNQMGGLLANFDNLANSGALDKIAKDISDGLVDILKELVAWIKAVDWKAFFKGVKETVVQIKDLVQKLGGLKSIMIGFAALMLAGPVAAIFSIIGAIWRLRLAFTALSVSATTSGAAVAGSFGAATTASMVASLGAIARAAGLLGAAAGIGWAIGTAINSALSDSTKDKIGETIARALAFFGNDEAQRALNANGLGRKANSKSNGLFTTNAEYGARARESLIANNQTKLNGEMTVKFENAPPGTRVDVGKTNQSGVFMNADVGYRRMVAGF